MGKIQEAAKFGNKIVKPFFSKKCNSGDQNIILCEDNKIINDTCEVSEKFNTFFSTVADKIGENIVYDPPNKVFNYPTPKLSNN